MTASCAAKHIGLGFFSQARAKCHEYFPSIAAVYGDSMDLLVCGGKMSLSKKLVRIECRRSAPAPRFLSLIDPHLTLPLCSSRTKQMTHESPSAEHQPSLLTAFDTKWPELWRSREIINLPLHHQRSVV